MKKKLVVFALIAILLAQGVSGTIAYFTAEDTARNVITTGGIDILLHETAILEGSGGDSVPFEDVEGVMPGAEISKIVEVENIGESDAWIRVKVTKAIALSEGVTGEPDLSLVEIDFNTDDWTEGQDGYYYYNQPLEAGYITIPLFTTVTFDTEMDNRYQGCVATIDVEAQAVQTANNGQSATEALGWSEKA